MRRSASEKGEIIRLVEGSELGVRRTLRELGIPHSTFYEWYKRYKDEGPDGLKPKSSRRNKFWNKIPPKERARVIETALDKDELSPRELAFHITDSQGWFISESSVYRILKERDLIASPAYIVMEAADKFKEFLDKENIEHTRGAPYHPQTQGKIERYHKTIKSVVKLDNYYFPGDLENKIEAFVDYYNNHRYHESLYTVTPADGYFGRKDAILRRRAATKRNTIKERREYNRMQKAI
jgi:transposase